MMSSIRTADDMYDIMTYVEYSFTEMSIPGKCGNEAVTPCMYYAYCTLQSGTAGSFVKSTFLHS
jgi:hypothetical protein